jgi:type II secretory ATPase GspE/PulE/Tfp pilus assembly ATPase PilB-like protein
MNEENKKIYEIISNEKMLHDIQSVVELVDSIICHGYHRNASDLHIDPTPEGIVVRFRVDGSLIYIDTLKNESHEELIARIKILSGLRTDMHFVPQDGRFKFSYGVC